MNQRPLTNKNLEFSSTVTVNGALTVICVDLDFAIILLCYNNSVTFQFALNVSIYWTAKQWLVDFVIVSVCWYLFRYVTLSVQFLQS